LDEHNLGIQVTGGFRNGESWKIQVVHMPETFKLSPAALERVLMNKEILFYLQGPWEFVIN
jgi:hypothetical protein